MREITDNTAQPSKLISFSTRFKYEAGFGEAYLVINLSGEKFAASLQSWPVVEGEDTLLLSADGTVLCSASGNLESVSDSWQLRTSVSTTHGGWQFINTVPYAAIMMPFFQISLIALLVAAGCILVGVLIVRRISIGVYRPIAEIIDDFHNEGDEDRRRDFLRKWLKQLLPSGIVPETELERLGLTVPEGREMYVALCGVDRSSIKNSPFLLSDGALIVFAVENVLNEVLGLKVNHLSSKVDSLDVALFIVAENETALHQILNEARESVCNALNLTVSIAVSECIDSLDEAPQAFDACRELLLHRLELGSGIITRQSVKTGGEDAALLNIQQDREQLGKHIRSGNAEGFDNALDKLIQRICSKPITSPEHIYMPMLSVMAEILSVLADNGWSASEVYGAGVQPLRELSAIETIAAIADYLKEMQAISVEYLNEPKSVRSKESLELAKNYISAHYSEDLRLSDVADQVYVSPSHLSRLFRQHMDKTFLEYVTEIGETL